MVEGGEEEEREEEGNMYRWTRRRGCTNLKYVEYNPYLLIVNWF